MKLNASMTIGALTTALIYMIILAFQGGIEEKRAAEAKRAEEQGALLYENVARSPKGTSQTFTGKIEQIIVEGNALEGRISITPYESYNGKTDYKNDVYFFYRYNEGEELLIEGDVIEVKGVMRDHLTYRTFAGGRRTVPSIDVSQIRRITYIAP